MVLKVVRNKSGVLAPTFVKLFFISLWGFFGVPVRKIQLIITSKAEPALKLQEDLLRTESYLLNILLYIPNFRRKK